MRKDVVLIAALVLFLFSTAYATTWYVHPDSALNSIQAALDSCADNDTVLVGPGLYYENIVWPNTQGIDLKSELGPDTTIIDGDGAGRVIGIGIEVDSTTIINGFTIRNGYTTHGGGIFCAGSPMITANAITDNTAIGLTGSGGGIYCYWESSPTIKDNTIAGNMSPCGGGIMYEYSSPTIIDNSITANIADFGGGMYCRHGSYSIITGNTITGNTAYTEGGGICCYTNSSSIIIDNIITGNTALCGGGIDCQGSSPTIKDNTITDNTADIGGGISCWLESYSIIIGNLIIGNTATNYGGGIYCYWESSPTIKDNTITGNTACYGAGISCMSYSSPIIDSCTISSNNGDGVYCEPYLGAPSYPVIHHNDITDNTGYGVCNVDSSVLINAINNWWGDPSGPGGWGPGTGEEVSKWVGYFPWLGAPIGIEEHESFQTNFSTLRISPNPFSKTTEIRYQIPETVDSRQYAVGSIKIYDAAGRLVKNFSGLSSGIGHQSSVKWDGCDDQCRRLPSGVYFLKFKAGDYTATEKLLLIR